MVKEMQKSVAGFKLPGVVPLDNTMIMEAVDPVASGMGKAKN